FDALIIGAGISGLVAAVRLLESRPAARLLVLEAKDRVGGRTLSTALPSSGSGGTDWWDLGGQWVGDCQPRVCQLAEELGISRYQQFNEGRKLLQLADGRVTNYSGELPSIGLLGNLDLAQAIYRFESRLSVSGRSSLVPEAAGSEPASLPELPSDQALLDGRTMSTEAAGLCWTRNVRSLLDSTIRILFGQEPAAVSALYAARMFHSVGDFQRLISDMPDGAQGYRLAGGAQSLSLRLADRLGPGRLRLGSPVAGVEEVETASLASTDAPDGGARLAVRLSSGDRLLARLVIAAVPPNQLARLALPSSEPAAVSLQTAVGAAVPSHYAKFIITYSEAWWRRLGYSGELFSCDPLSPIVTGFDGTTDTGSAALVLLSAGRPSQDLECLPTPEARREAVLRHLAKFFPHDSASGLATDCLHFAEKFWRAEPFNGGCPSDVAPCGFGRFHLADLAAATAGLCDGRLLFAGTEFARRWVGYMEGAIESGERAATAAATKLEAGHDG
ncbi:hypothetical protein BOX15_Mlig027710g1, partial [Macrostomum lignano]